MMSGHGVPHRERGAVGVHVGPRQSQQLALTKPGGGGEGHKRAERLVLAGVEQAPKLVAGQILDLTAGDARRTYQGGDVAVYQPVSYRVL